MIRIETNHWDKEAKAQPFKGYCKHEAQEGKRCLPSTSPVRVHIQLTHLSWPVLTTHSVAKLKMIADTRFWWAAGTETESLRPSGRSVTFRIESRGWELRLVWGCTTSHHGNARLWAGIGPSALLRLPITASRGPAHRLPMWQTVRSYQSLKSDAQEGFR